MPENLMSGVIVSIPHSSLALPYEIDEENINPKAADDIYLEVDVGTEKIYSFTKELGNQQIVFPYNRSFIDVNQDPHNLDNSICLTSIYDIDLYIKPPSEEERLHLLHTYHKAYHMELSKMARNSILIFDGHSTSVGDKDDHGDRFDADISIGNCQVASEDSDTLIDTCDKKLMDLYVEALKSELNGKYTINTNTKYLMNTYGYIEGRYGQRQNKYYSTPVLLQELNEALYTDEKGDFNKKEMEFLRVCFATALQAAVEQYFG